MIHHVDKELYNQVAEFEAAVSTQAFDAALQIAASVNPSAVTGIVPSGADPQLYISLRTAVQSARNRLPDFKIRMDVDLLPAALIRVRQAIDTGDINGVTAVAMRFPETPAAAEAHAWLGDRALAAGNFQRALDHFRETHAADSSQAESQYTSKMILTAAMLGVNISNSRSTAASLNNRVLTASDFQQLVDEMRKRHPTGHDPCVQVNSSHSNAGRLTRLSQDPVIRFHENMTDVREFTKPADTGELLSDRLVRRLNLTVAGTQLFANTGCQIAAFNSPDGKRLWTSRSTDGGSLRPEPIAPLRQCITASWLFARQWTANGPALVCLSRRTGERQWIRPSTETEVLISDPILHRGNLYALIAAHSDKHQVSVRLMRFDPASGQSLTGRELVRLKQSWWQRRLCRVSARVDSFIAGLGEVVICADFSGQVRWMRSYTTVPADVDPTWLSQPFEPPLVDHRHVYLTQPGTRVVECLQRAGGELRWRTVVPSIRRLTGLTKSHVIAIIDQGLQAFTRDSGAVAWTHLCQQPVNWAHCSDDRYVVFSRRKSLPGPAGNAVPELIWLDVADGRE
ncbi:MAG: PQQ-binding-like beta-propeller repeat protein, partial [Planctomycetaceae bacterium]